MPLHQHYEVTWRIEQNLNAPRRQTLCTKRVLTCGQVLELVGSDARELALRYPASPICRKHVSWYQGRNFQGAMGFKVGHKIPERWRGASLRVFFETIQTVPKRSVHAMQCMTKCHCQWPLCSKLGKDPQQGVSLYAVCQSISYFPRLASLH